MFPVEYNPQSQHWLLIDRVVQQLVLQQPVAPSRAASDLTTTGSDTPATTEQEHPKVYSFIYDIRFSFVSGKKYSFSQNASILNSYLTFWWHEIFLCIPYALLYLKIFSGSLSSQN